MFGFSTEPYPQTMMIGEEFPEDTTGVYLSYGSKAMLSTADRNDGENVKVTQYWMRQRRLSRKVYS